MLLGLKEGLQENMYIAQAGKAARRPRISQSVSLVFLLVLFSALTAGCGGGAGDVSTSTGAASSVTPTPTPAPTPGAPTVSLSASPSTVTTNGTSTLNWSSTNATSCSASGGWSGTKSISGSQGVGPLTANTTYTLACTGAGGSNSSSVTISVSSVKVYTMEIAWAPNSDNPDGYSVYLGTTTTNVTNLVKSLVKGATDWDPLAPVAQIPSTTVQSIVGSGSQACVQIKAYNSGGLSAPSQATCVTLP